MSRLSICNINIVSTLLRSFNKPHLGTFLQFLIGYQPYYVSTVATRGSDVKFALPYSDV